MIMAFNNDTAKDVTQAGEQLFRFAIDRGDMKAILDSLPVELPEKRAALEYEIQLLRIIAVGWAIAFFLGDSDLKTPLGQWYWENMQTFSATLSTSAALTLGSNVDYFDIVKLRLDYYVDALATAGKIPQPSMAIGPAFADICGDRDDACAVLAGSKMFAHTVGAVREYLDESVLRWD
jgi:hypothetical protein